MKVISPGRWIEEALQLSMTKTEWIMKTKWTPILSVKGKNSTMHYCLIEGEKVIVYELTEEAARLEQMEAAPVV